MHLPKIKTETSAQSHIQSPAHICNSYHIMIHSDSSASETGASAFERSA